jgi:hypothetical protein
MAYVIIPSAYVFLAKLLYGDGFVTTAQKQKYIRTLDMALTALFGVIPVILVLVGSFSDLSSAGSLLLGGITMGILYTIGYIIIQSKQMDSAFISDLKLTDN